jgi:nucleotide-binding universal stress UspA family protein
MIIAALDFSDANAPVIKATTKLAKALDESVYLVHVIEPEPTYAAYGLTPDEFPIAQEIHEETRHRSKQKLTKIAAQMELANVKIKVLHGQPLNAILDYAHKSDADTLVLDSHGHGFLSSLLLGSVAEGCVRESKIPFLIVPVKRDT